MTPTTPGAANTQQFKVGDPVQAWHPDFSREVTDAVREIGKRSTAPDKDCPIWLSTDILNGMIWMYERLNQSQPQPADRPAAVWSYVKEGFIVNESSKKALFNGGEIRDELNRYETETAALRDELEKWDERFEAYQLANKIINDELRDELERAKAKCEADHCDINELIETFERAGYSASEWDGEEGAEKAIVNGVNNIVAELQEDNKQLQAENERLRSGVSAEELENFMEWLSQKGQLYYLNSYYEFYKKGDERIVSVSEVIAAFRGREGK